MVTKNCIMTVINVTLKDFSRCVKGKFPFLVHVETEFSSAKNEAEANTASVKSTYIKLNPSKHSGKYKFHP